MEINYRNELGRTYMDVPVQCAGEGFEQRILCENMIDGLVAQHNMSLDGETVCCYDITGLRSLEKYLSRRQADYELLAAVMGAAAKLPSRLEEYLISEDHMMLSPQTVFLTPDGRDVFFCVCADADCGYEKGMNELSAFFMRKADHQDEKCVSAVYRLFDITSDSFLPRDVEQLFYGDLPKIETPDEDILWLKDEDATDEEVWDEAPVRQETSQKKNRKEQALKIAGIAAPVAAVIVVGLYLFL